MECNFDERVYALIEALGLAGADEVVSITPLTGGVSSEIALVQLPDRQICVKFALARLKVAAEWHAPVHRNSAEYRWLEYAADFVPDNVPALVGHSEELGGFAMQFVAGPNTHNWKALLLERAPETDHVLAMARLLGAIHAHSATDDKVADLFDNQDDFYALRIDPYLESLVLKHRDLTDPVMDMVHDLQASSTVLIHGDVSPKNILILEGRPILLDAECATMGDPAFDVAFCLCHLLLKGVHLPQHAVLFEKATLAFLDEYDRFLSWESKTAFEARLARLLPMLLLARVDGKSPVEYLNAQQQDKVRTIARSAIASAASTIAPLLESLAGETV